MRHAHGANPLCAAVARVTLLIALFAGPATAAATHSVTLTDNRWEQLVFPVLSDSHTIGTVLGDDLPLHTYADTWTVFTYDPISGAYANPRVNDVIDSGHAFWIVQMTGSDVEIDIDRNLDELAASLSPACRSANGCLPVALATRAAENTWQMLGSPFPEPVRVADFSIASLAPGSLCTAGCDLNRAEQSGYVGSELFYYSSTTGRYQLANTSTTLNGWQGFWLAALPAQPGMQLELLLPDPAISSACGEAAFTDAHAIVTTSPLAEPVLGERFTEPDFSSCVTRITDVASVDGIEQIGPTYSQLQAYNADQTLMLMRTGHIVDTSSLDVVHQVNFGWPAFGEGLRWSPDDPRLLYYTGGLLAGSNYTDPDGIACASDAGRLMRYRLSAGPGARTAERQLAACFQEYTNLHKDASWEELSDDGRYVALVGMTANPTQYHVFSYDVQNAVKGAVLDLPVHPQGIYNDVPNFAVMSPSGKYVLIQYNVEGMIAYERNTMAMKGQVAMTGGHGDITMDNDGTEYYMQTNASNYHLLSDAHYLTRSRIPDGVIFNADGSVNTSATLSSERTVPLLKLDWSASVHISCRNHLAPGWCVVSTSEFSDNGRQALDAEVFRIFLDSTVDTPHLERLSHHRSDPKNCGYWASPFATSSPNGSRIMYASSWDRPNCSVNAYEISLR